MNMVKIKPKPEPPPGQHPMVEEIRKVLVDKINEMNKKGRDRITISKIAEMCGMSHQFIAAFKTDRRCVKDFPLDTFMKLTDGVKMDRWELVRAAEDILTPKIRKALDGTYRQLFHKILDLLMVADPNQIEILEGLVDTIHRQTDEKDPPRARGTP